MTRFRIKRIYDPADQEDGYRVLVDRLWPRGVSKERAHLNEWAKDLAPSTDLRQWFRHDPDKFAEFARRYFEELELNEKTSETLSRWEKYARVTLLYGAKDQQHNEAVVLLDFIEQ